MTYNEFIHVDRDRQLWHLYAGIVGLDDGSGGGGANGSVLGASRAVGPFREVAAAGPVALANVPCKAVIFNNTTGDGMKIRRGVADPFILIPDQCGMEFDVLANANELTAASVAGTAKNLAYQCVGEAVTAP